MIGACPRCVSVPKKSGSKDSLERPDQPPILRTALLHAKGVQHLCRAMETDRAALLAHREGGQEYRHKSILPPGQAVTGWPVTCKRKCPFRRSCSRTPFPGCRIGSPHRTKGLAANPRFCVAASRRWRTISMAPALRNLRFETTRSPSIRLRIAVAITSKPRARNSAA
jgi:hypothetical protein